MIASEINTAPLVITLFGPLQVLIYGNPLPTLRSRKALWLLALLVLRHDRPVAREWLAGTLWPDVDQSTAFANLRPIVSELRKALGSESARLQSPDRHTLRLDIHGAVVDVIAFDTAASSKNLSSQNLPMLAQAVALYHGPLLEGCTEEWAFQERNSREQQCLQMLQILMDAALVAGDYPAAIGYCQQAVRIDPLLDAARRGWMEALAKSGDRNAALQIYREFIERLRKDDPMAVPDEQTSALYARLRAEIRHKSSEQPSLKATESAVSPASGSLPHALTELVGREDERIEVSSRLRRSRLVTLTGLGGIGKTRLAIEVAKGCAEEFVGGVWLVALEAVTAGPLVTKQIAFTLGIQEEPGRVLLQSVTEHLKKHRALLVLDNCEHLLEASAQVVAHLLRECTELRILATSREPLGILGETAWAVPALSAPEAEHLPKKTPALLRLLMGYESIQLFVERATAVQSEFALTESNALAVAEICARLEGIPLAIELAAVRVKAMTVEQIASRLSNEMSLLTGGYRGMLPRQQTLRAALDWSYDLLTEAERVILRQLSVFVGGWTLEAAEQVCGERRTGEERQEQSKIQNWEVLDLLSSLVDKSLVVFDVHSGGAIGRYRFLEMVRQYAAGSLEAIRETEQIRRRHCHFFLALAETAEPQLNGGKQGEWLTRLETEHENLRAALAWCNTTENENEEEEEIQLRLVCALWRFWEIRGHYREGKASLLNALGRVKTDRPTKRQAIALNAAGLLTYYQGDYAAAKELHEASLTMCRQLDYRQGMAWPLHHLGLLASRQGDYTVAKELHEEGLSLWRELGNKPGIAWTLHQLASVAREQGRFETARSLSTETLTLWRELEVKQGIAWALNDLGNVNSSLGDYETAKRLYSESLEISRELGDKQGTAWSLHHQAGVIGLQGDYAVAQTVSAESLEIFRELGDKQGTAWALHQLGNLVFNQGDYATAEALQQEGLQIQRRLGNRLGIARSLSSLGKIAFHRGDLVSAWERYADCIAMQRVLGDRRGAVESLEGLTALLLTGAEWKKAALVMGAAEALRESMDLPRAQSNQQPYEQQLQQVRTALGEEEFAANREQGRALTWEESAIIALEVKG